MAFYEDFAPCPHFGKWEACLTAVGWLEVGRDYPTGSVSEEFFAALVRLCADPWQPAVAAGRQPCSFCRFTGGPGQLAYQGMNIELGAANVFIPGSDRIFVAPTTVAHYIDAHLYAPPPAFQEAVIRCPDMRSMAYLRAIKDLGLTIGHRHPAGV